MACMQSAGSTPLLLFLRRSCVIPRRNAQPELLIKADDVLCHKLAKLQAPMLMPVGIVHALDVELIKCCSRQTSSLLFALSSRSISGSKDALYELDEARISPSR